MENKPFVDSGILAPVSLGVLSIVGIIVIFFGGINASRPSGETVSTETPFRYVYLGTEPGLSTLTPEPTATPIFIELLDPSSTVDSNESSFLTSTSPTLEFSTQPSVRTSTSTATETLQAVLNKFDDTYSQFVYDGDWEAQSDVTGTHQNTLHISFEVGNYVSFTFVGQQVIVSYQAGPSLGTILINLDGLEFEVSQANSQTQLVEWRSPVLVMGTHEIAIEHLSGGSVNLDSLIIPDLTTPTPTPTPTATP